MLEAGSSAQDGGEASWGPTEIDITTNPSSGDVSFNGNIGTLSFTDGADSLAIDGLVFSGRQSPTKFGIPIGDLKLELDTMSVASGGAQAGGLKHMSVDGTTTLDDGRLSGRTQLEMESQSIPQFGEFSVVADISLEGADAMAVGALQQALEAQGTNPDPGQLFATVEDDLKRLLAAGFDMRLDQFDVALPMGTVKTKLDISIPEEDAATFEWTSLMIGPEASADISVPEALIDMALQMSPEAGAVVAMGFLQKNGDVYEMQAEYKKGLLTINGAPIPIPFGAIQ